MASVLTFAVNYGEIEQIIGREGETATLFSRCLVTLNLCGGGFAPRQFNRSAFRGYFKREYK